MAMGPARDLQLDLTSEVLMDMKTLVPGRPLQLQRNLLGSMRLALPLVQTFPTTVIIPQFLVQLSAQAQQPTEGSTDLVMLTVWKSLTLDLLSRITVRRLGIMEDHTPEIKVRSRPACRIRIRVYLCRFLNESQIPLTEGSDDYDSIIDIDPEALALYDQQVKEAARRENSSMLGLPIRSEVSRSPSSCVPPINQSQDHSDSTPSFQALPSPSTRFSSQLSSGAMRPGASSSGSVKASSIESSTQKKERSDDGLSVSMATDPRLHLASSTPSVPTSLNMGNVDYVTIDMPAAGETPPSTRQGVALSPSSSIWLRLIRTGQWVTKKETSAESVEEAGLSDVSEDGSAGNRTSPRKQKEAQRSKRWMGSSNQMGSAEAAKRAPEDPFAQDGTATIHAEANSLRQMKSLLLDGRKEPEEPKYDPGASTDYLHSTMQGLFARTQRNVPFHGQSRRFPTALTPSGSVIQYSRPLNDRIEDYFSTSAASNRGAQSPHGSIGPGPITEFGSIPSTPPVPFDKPEMVGIKVDPGPPTLSKGSNRRRADAACDSRNGRSSEQQTKSSNDRLTSIPSSEALKTFRRRVVSEGTKRLEGKGEPLSPRPLTSKRDLSASNDQTDCTTQEVMLVPSQVHGADKDVAECDTARRTETQKAPESWDTGSLPVIHHSLSRNPTAPVMPPVRVEPPDLSASSLNFETGGMVPEKYMPAANSERKTSRVFARFQGGSRKGSGSPHPAFQGLSEANSHPEMVKKPPRGILEAFFQPLHESPLTDWRLLFPLPVESLYRVWLFHLWMKPFEQSALGLLCIFNVGWAILEWCFYTTTLPTIHIGSMITAGVCLFGFMWTMRMSWETWWYRFMWSISILQALNALNVSAQTLFLSPEDGPEDEGLTFIQLFTVSRIIFVQTCVSVFGPIPFYQLAAILFVITAGQVGIEVGSHSNDDGPSERIIGSALLYVGTAIVCLYFRYAGEVHLRKAFIKYRVAYRNQERLFAAREQSEYLLSMILPAKVIETLHNLQGRVSDRLILSTHETFLELHGVTIMFADLVGFTEFSSSITADTLVEVLSELFSEFDAVVSEFGLETIKTIGDCIQVAGGVPEQLTSEADIANQAEKICAVALIMLTTTKRISAHVGRTLKLRIGIHTGTVIGGVMGLWKFKYDIWSKDVDIASYIEQSGKPGIPHLSYATYALLHNHSTFSFSPAQTITAFGKEIPTYDMLVLESNDENLEQLASRLRVRESLDPLGRSKRDGSGEAVTAAAVRQAIGASGALMFTEIGAPGMRHSPHTRNKNNIGGMMKNFARSIRFWQSTFRDPTMEESYRDSHVRNWPGATIVSSCVVFILYLCLLGMHIAVFRSISSHTTFAIEGAVGLVMLSIIIVLHQINLPLRQQTIVIMDKGDRLGSALWMSSAEEIGRRPNPEYGREHVAGILDQQRPDRQSISDASPRMPGKAPRVADKWGWLRPNTSAILLAFLLLITIAIHFGSWDPSVIVYHNGAMMLTLVTCIVHPGIRMFYLNIFILIASAIYIIVIASRESQTYLITGVGLIVAVAIRANRTFDIISRMNFYVKLQTERDYAETKSTQAAAERMLLNILPLNVVQRLKDNPALRIADDKEEVSILFCFISNVVSQADATEIENIWTLNDIICDIDALARTRSVEKIKTIGKYMAMAEPIAEVPEYHLERLCDFALDLLDVVRAFNARSGQSFGLRTGIHVGPAVCGLIGTKTFTFDVWGDTVNVASRMESTGVDESIQVTQAVYDRIKTRFMFTPRGTVYVKGKGEMETYFLTGRNAKVGGKRDRERRISMSPALGMQSLQFHLPHEDS
ncbi:adenylate and guanylate cyclase catalytic domain-containing protein [Fimicolochytrium jonesii]|uniref:adenylate and guanylate cyclase catalytic domain-containing protein n=1 Tax=Fimicolochytrium jonesii TaxID=1396493 RepID=UPI0022FEC242|nr:adenylate and guanylate cyclase catalytic domain-containing protein [Fimicolochytrium jonesii]KAI8826090.1 adenylate and guanylate cyclase catalytic domain-containing protein [Fimicolochytrium jonesii]